QQRGPFRPGGSRPVTGAEGLMGRGNRGIYIGLVGAVVARDADVVSWAVAQHRLPSTADFAAVDDVGPYVGGDTGRGSAGDHGHDDAFGQALDAHAGSRSAVVRVAFLGEG